jgi:DNA (cytosine-5)-methyltransferase 1
MEFSEVICLPKENIKNENIAVLEVTHEFLTQGNVRLRNLIDNLIPKDAIGAGNKKKKEGKKLTLILSGQNKIIETDIPEDKKLFRHRPEIKKFAIHHNLQIGDKIYLERMDNDVFRLRPSTKQFSFIDLFAGIGGMRIAFEKAGGKCVFSSEWDEFACKTYEANFGDKPRGDIYKIPSSMIPDHDILVAGFPCQPFSISGVSKKNSLGKPHGFDDPTQGNLFFEIKRIIQDKRPLAFLLENVKNLKSHDKGNTYKVIRNTLEELGYTIYDEIIDAVSYVPQHRERIFIAGFRDPLSFSFPKHVAEKKPVLKDILDKTVPDKYTLTDHLWSYLQKYAEKHRKAGNGFGFGLSKFDGHTRTLSARYYKDGSEILIPQGKDKNPRRLTPQECARLMGFTQLKPDFKIIASDTRAYKQFGNAVVVPVVYDIAKKMLHSLSKEYL